MLPTSYLPYLFCSRDQALEPGVHFFILFFRYFLAFLGKRLTWNPGLVLFCVFTFFVLFPYYPYCLLFLLFSIFIFLSDIFCFPGTVSRVSALIQDTSSPQSGHHQLNLGLIRPRRQYHLDERSLLGNRAPNSLTLYYYFTGTYLYFPP